MNLFDDLGILVDIKTPQNFLKIAETLTRMGILDKTNMKLVQSCNILHKKDENNNSHYAILHFKELFKLDGKPSNFSENDLERRNRIAIMLENWGLVTILQDIEIDDDIHCIVGVIPHKDKNLYNLVSKYTIGKR